MVSGDFDYRSNLADLESHIPVPTEGLRIVMDMTEQGLVPQGWSTLL